jgi:hypothetical protein
MDFGWLQWPAMLVTVIAAWLVGSTSRRRRSVAFWTFLASNALWIAWGWADHAHALIVLQVCLAAMNIRGARKNDPDLKPDSNADPRPAADAADPARA